MNTLYKNHGTSIGYWTIEVTDRAELRIAHARTLDGKETARIHPVEGKNIGRSNETTPLEQAHLEMQSRIKKQLDKGYVETLAAAELPVTNTLGFSKPVLATVLEKVKPESIDWGTATLQPKLNGNRCLYKDGQLYSRGGKVINLPHVVEAIHAAGLWDLHLDGELYVHGMPLQQINSRVKKLQDVSLELEYHIYDVVDEANSFYVRYVGEFDLPGCNHFDDHQIQGPLWLVPTVEVKGLADVMTLERRYTEAGYEGAMLRHGSEGYETGKRSRRLLKVKTYSDAEAEVIGWVERTPNIIEGRGALSNFVWVCKNPFGEGQFEVTAEGNWQDVHDQSLTAEQQIGRQLKFKYFELSTDRIPQQPVALGWKEKE